MVQPSETAQEVIRAATRLLLVLDDPESDCHVEAACKAYLRAALDEHWAAETALEPEQ